MIKGIIFDCFGVLLGRGFWNTYQAAGGDAVGDGEFLTATLQATNRGAITPAEFHRRMINRLGITMDEWTAVMSRVEVPNQQLFDYIRDQLKPRYKIGFLCNANIGVVEQRLPVELLNLFDDRIISAEVGLMKPDPRIYQLASERLGLAPKELVFCDDKPIYTEAAAKLGIKPITYIDFDSFRQQVESILAANTNS